MEDLESHGCLVDESFWISQLQQKPDNHFVLLYLKCQQNIDGEISKHSEKGFKQLNRTNLYAEQKIYKKIYKKDKYKIFKKEKIDF